MKKSRFTDSQIMNILKQAANGTPIPDLCREHGMIAYRRGNISRYHTSEYEQRGLKALEKHLEVEKFFREIFPFIDS